MSFDGVSTYPFIHPLAHNGTLRPDISKSDLELAGCSDVLKCGLFHYRDRHGLEADMVVSKGGALSTVEAKAGRTIAGDMLNTVRKIHTELHPSAASEACLVYGGDTAQKRSDVIVLPWHELHTHIWPDT